MTDEDYLEAMELYKWANRYILLSIAFDVLAIIMLFKSKDWFYYWGACQIGGISSYIASKRFHKQAKEISNGGRRSN